MALLVAVALALETFGTATVMTVLEAFVVDQCKIQHCPSLLETPALRTVCC